MRRAISENPVFLGCESSESAGHKSVRVFSVLSSLASPCEALFVLRKWEVHIRKERFVFATLSPRRNQVKKSLTLASINYSDLYNLYSESHFSKKQHRVLEKGPGKGDLGFRIFPSPEQANLGLKPEANCLHPRSSGTKS